jgi:hypothetical protein
MDVWWDVEKSDEGSILVDLMLYQEARDIVPSTLRGTAW